MTNPYPPNPHAHPTESVTLRVGGQKTAPQVRNPFNLGEANSLAQDARAAQSNADMARARLYACIKRLASAGCPQVEIATATKLSPQRVGQVIKS